MPSELKGGRPGNPIALSHLGLRASQKPHKSQGDGRLVPWCMSWGAFRGCSAGWRAAPWPLVFPTPSKEGPATALLTGGPGMRWTLGVGPHCQESVQALFPSWALSIRVGYEGWTESQSGVWLPRVPVFLESFSEPTFPLSRMGCVIHSSLQSDTCVCERVCMCVWARMCTPAQ